MWANKNNSYHSQFIEISPAKNTIVKHRKVDGKPFGNVQMFKIVKDTIIYESYKIKGKKVFDMKRFYINLKDNQVAFTMKGQKHNYSYRVQNGTVEQKSLYGPYYREEMTFKEGKFVNAQFQNNERQTVEHAYEMKNDYNRPHRNYWGQVYSYDKFKVEESTEKVRDDFKEVRRTFAYA